MCYTNNVAAQNNRVRYTGRQTEMNRSNRTRFPGHRSAEPEAIPKSTCECPTPEVVEVEPPSPVDDLLATATQRSQILSLIDP